MSELVAVKSAASCFPHIFKLQPLLKREALLFKRIAIPDLRLIYESFGPPLLKQYNGILRELEWLVGEGIVFEPRIENYTDIKLLVNQQMRLDRIQEMISYAMSSEKHKVLERFDERVEKGEVASIDELVADLAGHDCKDYIKSMELFQLIIGDYLVRAITIQLRELNSMNAYPLLGNLPPSSEYIKDDRSTVIQIALNSLPVPDDSVSWEQILDFRSDPDSTSKFLALRNWISEVARAELTTNEIEEKLEYLIDQYKQHMKLHKMKTSPGALENIVVGSGELVENLIKGNFGKLAKGLFFLKHRRIALMEGELTAPGNEIAYNVKAREEFS